MHAGGVAVWYEFGSLDDMGSKAMDTDALIGTDIAKIIA